MYRSVFFGSSIVKICTIKININNNDDDHDDDDDDEVVLIF
jgi:hypothetical protein